MKLIFCATLFVFVCFVHANETMEEEKKVSNRCIQFSVGQGTGCDWMCNYCSQQLGTFNYYFTDNVCT